MANWLILILLWSAISFNFFLVVFYVGRMSGDVFVNTFFSNLSDVIGSLVAGFALIFLGIRNTLIISFIGTALTCEVYLASSANSGTGWFAILLLVNKFFINIAYTTIFFSSAILFNADIVSTVFATTHVVAKGLTIFSSILAQA